MADLSQTAPRVGKRDRLASRRDSIIPNRRNTEQPQRQVFADMRSARRGDGGAQELMRVLAGSQRASDALSEYAEQNFRVTEDRKAAEGAAAQAAGTVDDRQMARSRAYRQAVSRGRAQQSWFEFSRSTEQAVRELTNNQSQATPEERNAEIDQLIEGRFHDYALDPETHQARDFGDPSVTRWVAEQMPQLRAQLRSRGYEAAEGRLNEEAITTATDGLRARILAGQPIDIEDSFHNLPPTADRRAAKRAFVAAVQDVATQFAESGDPEQEAQALRLVDQLRGSRRGAAPGAPAPASTAIREVDPDTGLPPAADAAADTPPGEAPAFRPDPAALAAAEGRGGGQRAAESAAARVPPTGRPPIAGQVTNTFAQHRARGSNGVDLAGRMGDPIEAPAGGVVKAVGHDARSGNFIIIDHGTDAQGRRIESSYSHLSRQDFRRGQQIAAGDVLGAVGATGHATGPHLHWVVRVNGREVDPMSFRFGATEAPAGTEVPSSTTTAARPRDPVAEASANPGNQLIPELHGQYSLTPAERADLGEFRARLADRIDNRREHRERETQQENAGSFLDRLNGNGAYPTREEIMEARRDGRLSAEGATSLVNIIRSDSDRAEARVDRAEARADRASRNRAEARIAALMAPVYTGTGNLDDARSAIVGQAAQIRDPMERRLFTQGALGEVGMLQQSREQSPAFRSAMGDLEMLKSRLVLSLGRNPRGGAERARAHIEAMINTAVVSLGRAASNGADINQEYQRLTRSVMDIYRRNYSRGATAAADPTNQDRGVPLN